MTSIQEFFEWGLMREIPPLAEPPALSHAFGNRALNLGPGDVKVIPNTIGVGRPNNKLTDVAWVAPERLPFESGSISEVHAHHFLEHFDAGDVVKILREIERVLCVGGVAYCTVPYAGSAIDFRALDHLTRWNEESWEWIFNTTHYNDFMPVPWKLRLHTVFIMGIVGRNLCVFAQLVKEV